MPSKPESPKSMLSNLKPNKSKSLTPQLMEKPKKEPTSWIQAMLWLMMSLVAGVLTLMLWMASESPAMQAQASVEEQQKATSTPTDFSHIKHIDELNELKKEVNPISFDTLVRDLRHYPDEFKDSRYFKEHEKEWTVQVMDVAEHDVITDYLAGREDRDKFAYFRYRDENGEARYILTYGVMPTPQMAMGAARKIDFSLPDNVRVLPEEIVRYLSIIENYEISEPVEDISLDRTRRVKLQPTTRELPPRDFDATEQELQEQSKNENSEDSEADANFNSSTESIRGSTDDAETLAVNVDRFAVASGANNGNTSTNNANNNSSSSGLNNRLSNANSSNNSPSDNKPSNANSAAGSRSGNAPNSSTANAPRNTTSNGGNTSTNNNSPSSRTLEAEVINPPRNVPIINDIPINNESSSDDN